MVIASIFLNLKRPTFAFNFNVQFLKRQISVQFLMPKFAQFNANSGSQFAFDLAISFDAQSLRVI
jgi:hypothetical protein